MNVQVRGLTPTELAIRERHLKFKQSIAEKAEALRRSKLELANEQMIAAFKAEAAALTPESFPAETDPPEAPKGTHWFGPSNATSGLTLHNYPSSDDILRAVAKYFGITKIALTAKRKTADVITARQVAYYLFKELTPLSLKQIGKRFGGKDHSSIHHGFRKVGELIRTDPDLAFDVAALIEQITGQQQ